IRDLVDWIEILIYWVKFKQNTSIGMKSVLQYARRYKNSPLAAIIRANASTGREKNGYGTGKDFAGGRQWGAAAEDGAAA
ncbi:MAG: hypothetical protein IJ461_05215, partial [Clostridia bacterium]|nr:hypothetical protein [Clostridia bacterium]